VVIPLGKEKLIDLISKNAPVLTGAVSAVGNALLVITLPSSLLEHYDESAERLFQQFQKIAGRMERIYTPVEDDEIEHVIRKRLFRARMKVKQRKQWMNLLSMR